MDLKYNDLLSLYQRGFSMRQLATRFNCSEHKIVYWMNKYNIRRRTRSDANYLYHNPKGDPFSIKEELSFDEMKLYGLGLGIYWGEGDKISRHQIRVANTNPDIIKTFIRFLREICQLKESKILYHLICFNDSNPFEASRYWAEELKISQEKFGKIVQISPQGKGTYHKKSQAGVCTVIVSNIKLKAWIMSELQKI